jgi:hypothetical protein
MKLYKSCAVALAGLASLLASSHGQGLVLNFVANTGTDIQFNGASDSFQFTSNVSGYQWHITTETGGSSSVGLLGSFNNGPFNYGPITTTGTGLAQVQDAPVLNPLANLVINDGTGNLSGTVNFVDVTTFYKTLGTLDAALNVNLTGVTYSGSNPDLQYLDAHQPGTVTLSFQFSPGETLTQLSTGTGPYVTSYSGSLSVVPEPSTLVLAGLSGLGVLLMRRRNK